MSVMDDLRIRAVYELLTLIKSAAIDLVDDETGQTYEQVYNDGVDALRALGVTQAELDDAGWWDE